MTLVFDTKRVTINYCIKNTKHCQQTCYPPDLQCISYKLLALKRENQREQQEQISKKNKKKNGIIFKKKLRFYFKEDKTKLNL